MKGFKQGILNTLAAVLYFTGISQLLCAIVQLLRPTVRILLYHSTPSLDVFREHMEYIRKRYTIIALDDIAANRIPKRSIAITFDDGFEDNYVNAYPVLKERGIPGTIFVTISCIGTENMVSWNQIKEMSADNIDIGGHTMSHPILSCLENPDAEKEIVDSKKTLEHELGKEISHFAYPKGKIEDFTANTIDLVHKAGFKTSCSTIRGLNKKIRNVFALKRTPIEPDDDIRKFRRTVRGYWDFLNLRRFFH